MKRLVSLLMCLLLAAASFAEDADLSTSDLPVTQVESEAPLLNPQPVGEEGTPFLGKWRLTALILESVETDPALYGITLTLNFTADGLVTVTDDLSTQTTVWTTAEGAAIVSGLPLRLTEDGNLIMNDDGTVMIYTLSEV